MDQRQESIFDCFWDYFIIDRSNNGIGDNMDYAVYRDNLFYFEKEGVDQIERRCDKCGNKLREHKRATDIIYCLLKLGFLTFVWLLVTIPVTILFIGKLKIMDYKFGKNNLVIDYNTNLRMGLYQNSVRDLSIELVRGCNASESCYYWSIYGYLKNFDYVFSEHAVLYPPVETLRTKSFDCKNAAFTLCTMLRSVGVDCYISFNKKEDHVVAVVEVNGQLIRSDLTIPESIYIESEDEIW